MPSGRPKLGNQQLGTLKHTRRVACGGLSPHSALHPHPGTTPRFRHAQSEPSSGFIPSYLIFHPASPPTSYTTPHAHDRILARRNLPAPVHGLSDVATIRRALGRDLTTAQSTLCSRPSTAADCLWLSISTVRRGHRSYPATCDHDHSPVFRYHQPCELPKFRPRRPKRSRSRLKEATRTERASGYA